MKGKHRICHSGKAADPGSASKAYPEEEPFSLVSSTDCTGLVPSLPESPEELQNYEELYPFLPKAKREDRQKQKPEPQSHR